jgi:hypothetical protein
MALSLYRTHDAASDDECKTVPPGSRERYHMLKIISGGQSGADRAALDAAIEAAIPYGGWCPNGGWAEDMPEPPGVLALYPDLRPTPETSPGQRTEWNVRDSDALMVLVDSASLAASKGTGFALNCAAVLKKPHIIIDIDAPDALPKAQGFLADRAGGSLCIGGPRESEAPGIYTKALALVTALFELTNSLPRARSPR